LKFEKKLVGGQSRKAKEENRCNMLRGKSQPELGGGDMTVF